MRVAVIGAGIVGLACAHFLAQGGHEVTVLDRDPEGDKCSWGNAGAIAVTELVPAAFPGVMWRVPFWLADPLGPLAVRPAHAPRLLPWLRRFIAAGSAAEVQRIAAALAALNARVMDDLLPVLDAIGLRHALHQAGALTVYETEAGFRREAGEWDLRRHFGIACEEMDGNAAREMEPALAPSITRAVFTPAWSHVSDPKEIWAGLLASLRARGVAVLRDEVTGLNGNGEIRGASGEARRFDRVVVAAGAWSARLAGSAGDRALLESERGYNTTIADPGISVTRELIFAERKFVATPLAIGLRIGGAAEFAGLEAPPNYARSRRLRTLARRYLPGLGDAPGTDWMGNRPATPDTLPVIGASPRSERIVYAFGHGHLGLTQAAPTGRLVDDIIAGRPSPIDLRPYGIERFA